MATSHLALAHRATPPAVFRYTLATTVQVGGTFGTAEANVFEPDTQLFTQRVAQFRGSNDLYALQRDEIYRYGIEDDTWTLVHTLASPDPTYKSSRLGPFVMNVNNSPSLVVIYKASTNQWYLVTSTDGAVWSEAGPFPGGLANPVHLTLWKPMVFNQTVWVWEYTAAVGIRYIGFNPTTNSVITVDPTTAVGATNRITMDHCVYNGRHYVLGPWVTDTARPSVFEFDGVGGFTLKWEPGVFGQGSLGNNTGEWCLFTDGSSMFALMNWARSGQTRGWDAYEFVESMGNLTPTQIRDTVIPVGIRQNTGLGSTEGFGAVIDAEANPGGVPDIYLYRRLLGTAGNTWSVYQWNGNGTLIGNAGSPNDTGGDVAHALAFDKLGSGKIFNATDELDIKIEGVSLSLGGETVSFRVYAPGTRLTISSVSGSFAVGDAVTFAPSGAAGVVAGVGATELTVDVTSGTVTTADTISGPGPGSANVDAILGSQGPETVNVEFYYSDQNETPQNQATLSNASAGTIVANQIQGIDADARGSTLYTVKWEAATDGVGNGDRVILQGRVSV